MALETLLGLIPFVQFAKYPYLHPWLSRLVGLLGCIFFYLAFQIGQSSFYCASHDPSKEQMASAECYERGGTVNLLGILIVGVTVPDMEDEFVFSAVKEVNFFTKLDFTLISPLPLAG